MIDKKHSELFTQVKKIIEETDPVQIVSFSPADEFDSEIVEIVKLLKRVSGFDEFYLEICKLFLKQFGEDTYLNNDKLKEMSKRVWSLKRE